jgi:CheY-like chemotaxis protein
MNLKKQKTILVIDDDADFLAVLCFSLKKAGFTVMPAISGKDALKKIARADAILMDAYMPDMNGWELLEILNKKDIKIPTLMMSGIASKIDQYAIVDKSKGIAPIIRSLRKIV